MILSLFLLAVLIGGAIASDHKLVNKQVKRVLTVTPGVVSEDVAVTVVNEGGVVESVYEVPLREDFLSISAFGKNKNKLPVKTQSKRAIVDVDIGVGESVELTLNIVYKARFNIPVDRIGVPSRMTLTGTSLLFDSPYLVSKQRTYIKYDNWNNHSLLGFIRIWN